MTFKPEQFGKELDGKFEEFKHKSMTDADDAALRQNLLELDGLKTLPGRCGNPDCGYPLSDSNYRVLIFGDVCRLCYDMYHVVNDRMSFVEAHRKWQAKMDEMKRKENPRDDAFDY